MELRMKLTVRDLFIFSMYQLYRSVSGIISILCTVAVLGVVVSTWRYQAGPWRAVLLLGLIVVLGCEPFMLYRRAAAQTRNPVLSKEISLKLDYSGIRAQQGKDKANVRWNQITKAAKIPGMYVLYMGKAKAYLVPEWALEKGKKEMFLELLRTHVPGEKRKGI